MRASEFICCRSTLLSASSIMLFLAFISSIHFVELDFFGVRAKGSIKAVNDVWFDFEVAHSLSLLQNKHQDRSQVTRKEIQFKKTILR